jgi:hypothetical protein
MQQSTQGYQTPGYQNMPVDDQQADDDEEEPVVQEQFNHADNNESDLDIPAFLRRNN